MNPGKKIFRRQVNISSDHRTVWLGSRFLGIKDILAAELLNATRMLNASSIVECQFLFWSVWQLRILFFFGGGDNLLLNRMRIKMKSLSWMWWWYNWLICVKAVGMVLSAFSGSSASSSWGRQGGIGKTRGFGKQVILAEGRSRFCHLLAMWSRTRCLSELLFPLL